MIRSRWCARSRCSRACATRTSVEPSRLRTGQTHTCTGGCTGDHSGEECTAERWMDPQVQLLDQRAAAVSGSAVSVCVCRSPSFVLLKSRACASKLPEIMTTTPPMQCDAQLADPVPVSRRCGSAVRCAAAAAAALRCSLNAAGRAWPAKRRWRCSRPGAQPIVESRTAHTHAHTHRAHTDSTPVDGRWQVREPWKSALNR